MTFTWSHDTSNIFYDRKCKVFSFYNETEVDFGGSILTHFEVVQKNPHHSTSKSSVDKSKGDMKKLKAVRRGPVDCLSNARRIILRLLTVISVGDHSRRHGKTRS